MLLNYYSVKIHLEEICTLTNAFQLLKQKFLQARCPPGDLTNNVKAPTSENKPKTKKFYTNV